MIFPREKKKELWRYASKNNAVSSDADGIATQQLQPLHPRHQRHLHRYASYCCCYTDQISMLQQLNSPPPPYSAEQRSIDSSGAYRQLHSPHQGQQGKYQQQQQQQQLMYHVNTAEEMAASVFASEESEYFIKNGCSFESSGLDLLSNENGSSPLSVPVPVQAYSASTLAMTAANMFRNCCGGRGSDSRTDNNSGFFSKMITNDNKSHNQSRQRTSSTHTCPLHPQSATLPTGGAVSSASHRHRILHQLFNALLNKLKNKQITELLRAVKSRVDPPHKRETVAGNSTLTCPSYLQCILIKCTSPFDEEHHVTTCQLFFWSDLRNATELRRLPTCPSARDYVYICCNPLHWFRINPSFDSDSAPPPYQRSKMLRLKDQDTGVDSQHNERSSVNTWTVKDNSISKKTELHSSLESYTTDEKDRNLVNRAWCQIAYWELGQRVGQLLQARKSAVNIYADGPVDSAGESICLRELSANRTPVDTVEHTRLKVGLGITLSLECGDVWIYNRSNIPIFVDSPTLAERLDHVCKVLPGYCVKAFETARAKCLATRQMMQTHLGPIDRFCMKISFAKGWGSMYRRQDVMGCPCWVEIHLSSLR